MPPPLIVRGTTRGGLDETCLMHCMEEAMKKSHKILLILVILVIAAAVIVILNLPIAKTQEAVGEFPRKELLLK